MSSDVVPIPAIVPAKPFRGRGRRSRLRGSNWPVDLNGKNVVEMLLGEQEQPVVPDKEPYKYNASNWFEQKVIGIFCGNIPGTSRDRMSHTADSVEEVLNHFDQNCLAPDNITWTEALEDGLVIILGPPSGKVKLIISNKDKAKLDARTRTWIKLLFTVDRLDNELIDVTTNLDAPYRANRHVSLEDFLGD